MDLNDLYRYGLRYALSISDRLITEIELRNYIHEKAESNGLYVDYDVIDIMGMVRHIRNKIIARRMMADSFYREEVQ
jgi:hypothetical protein